MLHGNNFPTEHVCLLVAGCFFFRPVLQSIKLLLIDKGGGFFLLCLVNLIAFKRKTRCITFLPTNHYLQRNRINPTRL